MHVLGGGAVSNTGKHWLYQWIDEFNVRTESDVFHLGESPGAMERLHEIASSVPDWAQGYIPDGQAIVAGATMDLSGVLTCDQANCIKGQVDKLFGNVWHYFDKIVVEGPNAHSFAHALENAKKKDRPLLFMNLWQDVSLLTYLREIGAEDYLVFQDKPSGFCERHGQKYAQEFGLDLDESSRAELAESIKCEASIKIVWRRGHWSYHVSHPAFPESFNGTFPSGRGKKKPTKLQVAERVVSRSSAALLCDLALSKRLKLPLAQEFSFLWSKGSRATSEATVQDVALSLPLPVMDGLPAADVIRLRKDEKPHFERFQHALTEAIREQVQRAESASLQEISKSVSEEFIRPALADIERSLKEAKKTLSVKSGLTVSVGSATATVGMLSSVPLIVAAGVGAAVSLTLTGANKFLDDKKDVKMSDVYFLWKAQQTFKG
ncbi:hypothetical protein [Streptomyces violaceusniger]|uniref:hypothetical protein n=1 Tax=Streptomyces violaceusniger TaxID=68280 RepID=UPI0036C7A1EF